MTFRRILVRLLVVAGVCTVGLALALGLGAPDPGLAERAYGAADGLLGCVASLVFVREQAGRAAAAPDAAEDDIVASNDPAVRVLSDLERALRLGRLTAGDFHVLLRPRLAELASSSLARRGVPLGSEAARAALGDAYALVDPAAPPPADRSDPGVPLAAVSDLVQRLEQLA